MKVVVLRLGHRPLRDKRITTHVALVARAFGAAGMLMSKRDRVVEKSLQKIVENWGGNFFIQVGDWRNFIKSWKGLVIHLTMYGLPIDEVVDDIAKTGKDVLVVVGSEKVPREVFNLADYNIAIGNQPHSEVSALAIFLDRFFKGKELKKDFKGKLKIIPSESIKQVERK